MKQLTPRQIIFGGCMLAFGAAFLNTGFIITAGTSVSHLTGDLSRIASGLASFSETNVTSLLRVLMATLGFIAGATASGFFLHHPTLHVRMPYGRMLSLIGLILFGADALMSHHLISAICVSGFACGMQNALASRYRGSVLRTTHVTGLFTDLGIHLGMKLRGHSIEGWKITIPIYISVSFFAGAAVSSFLVFRYQADWILYTAASYLSAGLIWSFYKRFFRQA
ncbi:YoaK family protein [Luteolibacter algae]|uniref:YoaK family protein n=1 Tax=Luteolibacter algae TaxID=454151 RepID=A0ABW5D5B8_9BACT